MNINILNDGCNYDEVKIKLKHPLVFYGPEVIDNSVFGSLFLETLKLYDLSVGYVCTDYKWDNIFGLDRISVNEYVESNSFGTLVVSDCLINAVDGDCRFYGMDVLSVCVLPEIDNEALKSDYFKYVQEEMFN